MEKETLRVGDEYKVMEEKAKRIGLTDGGLCQALWNLACNSYNRDYFQKLWGLLYHVYGKNPTELKTVKEFWAPELKKAVIRLVGEKYQADMEEMSRIRMECQFSETMFRRSYRSADFGYHAAAMIQDLCNWIYWTAYQKSAAEMLYYEHSWVRGYDMFLALELRRKNAEVVEKIREAMLGDNSDILLSHTMIRAVVISGHEELLELLLKLLLAARLQEGLRQQILEQADAGSIGTLTKILKLCIDEDMFRYSSAIRALGTWTGLGFDNEKPALVKKYAALAYECLTDEKAAKKYSESENNLEAYFAVWALACHETADCDKYVQKLLNDKKKYRRVLGWYFVSHSDSTRFQMQMAQKYLSQRDEELLAWIVSNLAVTWQAVSGGRWSREEAVPAANSDLPDSSAERRILFGKLKEIADYIGAKNRTFTGNPFSFSSITLENTRVISCMMSLAFYDFNQDMVAELAEYLIWMNVDQRYAYYRNYLKPEKKELHRKLLREALHDRSVQIKELAVERLSECTLLKEDMEVLAESLRSKSSSFRKNVLAIFKKQPQEKLSPIIRAMLASGEENQIQAGIELLLELKEQYPGLMEEQKAALEALKKSKITSQTEILLNQLLSASAGNDAQEIWNGENGFGLYNPEELKAKLEPTAESRLMGMLSSTTEPRWKTIPEVPAEPRWKIMPEVPEESRQNTISEPGAAAVCTGSARKGLFSRLFKKREAEIAPKNIPGSNETPAEQPANFSNTGLSVANLPSAGILTERELKQRITLPKAELDQLFERMNAVFERHADYEYEVLYYDGSRNKKLFGYLSENFVPVPAEYGTNAELQGKKTLEMIPFYEEFLEAAGEFAVNLQKYVPLYYLTQSWNGGVPSYMERDFEYQDWFVPFVKKELNLFYTASDQYKQRNWQIREMIQLIGERFDKDAVFDAVFPIYRSMAEVIGKGNLGRNYVQQKQDSRIYYYSQTECYPINMRFLGLWRQLLTKTAVSTEHFKEWFLEEYRMEQLADVSVSCCLGMADYFKVCDMDIVKKDVLYKQLLTGRNGETMIRVLTNPNRWQEGKKIYETYAWAKELVDTAVNRIAEVEEKRGELPTELTKAAHAIQRFEGAEHFARLLTALGKEKFFRGYAYSSDTTKQAILSQLLKRCYPAKEDTPEKLKEILVKTDIKDNRLAEAVMYAPQWAGFAEEILRWQGLKCAVWFFHAHINETFTAEKETETALYSPITPQQFNDGAFDKDWFFKAYETLGEKRFQVLYKSAKYITSGSNQHRRSQLYTDAVLGRLDAEELKNEIIEKRNQEKLRCYPLIPMTENQTEEALRRYEFIQKFLKESKQFGAQRRESEKKACDTAMENLAMTAGFTDVNRMTWYLESEKLNEIRPMMEPTELDGANIWIEIGKDGTAELAIEKNGKRQKTLPKTLNKNETVLTMKEVIKELKEQKRRAKESLERAMVDCTEFGLKELSKISGNPVLAPMLFSLVWIQEEKTSGNVDKQAEEVGQPICGFLCMEANKNAENNAVNHTENRLIIKELNGQEHPLHETINPNTADTSKLRIAHPHDLYTAGVWSGFMHKLYEEKLVQPFKQVFREYYPLTEDERQEKNISRRYAGHQVQPQKTVALLRGRGWTVDYEEGLQKVWYKENIIVRMYALADWFSPADIEAPTLEIIRFYDRNTGEILDLEKIPPILFSEAMRDMDLVVSVAHVGGVDPEASHSTVEMRTAIAEELVGLLRLSNVTFIGAHAKITGSLNNYSVHMGSGVVHAEAVGMIAILPVHSQARGRIFLPFADEDPKTAEIMSKIILLSEDTKIKDTSILSQIHR